MKRILIVLTVVFIIISAVFMGIGFDKKNNYYNGTYTSTNVYVGGDAYNYIINGTYFTGYMVLSGCSFLVSVFCISTLIISNSVEKAIQANQKSQSELIHFLEKNKVVLTEN